MRSLTSSQWRDLRMGVILRGFRSLNNSTSKRVLDLLLKSVYMLVETTACQSWRYTDRQTV